MKKILLGFLMIALVFNSFSQEGDCFVEIISESGIMVYLDNNYVGTTSNAENGLIIQDVASGTHALRFERKNFKSQRDVIKLSHGQVLTYKVKPFKPKLKISFEGNSGEGKIIQKTGSLIIQSLPTVIRISIPKLGINIKKPQDRVIIEELSVGTYSAILTWKQKKLNYTIIIKHNQTTHIMVNMFKDKVIDISKKNRSKELAEQKRLSQIAEKINNNSTHGKFNIGFKKTENFDTIKNKKFDQNGDKCAIIRFISKKSGLVFLGDMYGITRVERKDGEYWIYVPYGAGRLTIKNEDIEILDYRYPIRLKEGLSYTLTMKRVD